MAESWTSKTLGWMVMFKMTPEFREELYDVPQEKRPDKIREQNEENFRKLEELLEPCVRIVSQQEYTGTACVVGDEGACRRLKEKVESAKFANMTENSMCVFLATVA